MSFPWQIEQWQQLWHAKCEQRLPHALLFTGLAGTGKAQFADVFSRALLCQNAPASVSADINAYFCQTCHSCRLTAGRAHPNVLWIEPEKEGQAIKVDQIRLVSDFVNQSSLQGDIRVVIINPANNMNINAANALLKTLEEPASGAMMILVADQSAQLPATILSRCQRIVFPRPRHELAKSWLIQNLPSTEIDHGVLLRIAHGAPLAALQLVEKQALDVRRSLFDAFCALSLKQGDPIKLAAKLYDNDLQKMLDFTLAFMMDLLRLQLCGDEDNIINADYLSQLNEVKPRTQINTNAKFMQYLQQLRGQICTGFNLNKQLVTENMLIRWMGCVH